MISPELDFDDMESINENIPKARAMELIRLREENNELKEKLKEQREGHDAAPLGMTTFSPARESQS